MDVMGNGRIILIQSCRTGKFLKRHPNDIKKFEGVVPDPPQDINLSEADIMHAWREAFASIESMSGDGMCDDPYPAVDITPEGVEPPDNGIPVAVEQQEQYILPPRTRNRNPRYFNSDFQN